MTDEEGGDKTPVSMLVCFYKMAGRGSGSQRAYIVRMNLAVCLDSKLSAGPRSFDRATNDTNWFLYQEGQSRPVVPLNHS